MLYERTMTRRLAAGHPVEWRVALRDELISADMTLRGHWFTIVSRNWWSQPTLILGPKSSRFLSLASASSGNDDHAGVAPDTTLWPMADGSLFSNVISHLVSTLRGCLCEIFRICFVVICVFRFYSNPKTISSVDRGLLRQWIWFKRTFCNAIYKELRCN